jgi:hypothetical protein
MSAVSGTPLERGPLPANKFSLEYAVALWEQVKQCNIADPAEATWLVEALRAAAELALWGDRNETEVADYLLMESAMVSFVADVISTRGLDKRVYVQCVQCVVILLQNHTRESTLFFLLSNGRFNRIIEAPLDYNDDEIVSHFVSFLKTVTLRLQAKNILPLFCSGRAFPLLAAAMHSALLTHDDRMVRTSVRQVIAQLLRLRDEAVTTFAQGCMPRLIDDLGAFLEAQLRQLALLAGDEAVSQAAVDMGDEDAADEGLYIVDLLAGCADAAERSRMARLVRELVLDRILAHTRADTEGADATVAAMVLFFIARWMRSAPTWFVEACAVPAPGDGDPDAAPLFASLAWALLAPGASADAAMAAAPPPTVTRAALCVVGALYQRLVLSPTPDPGGASAAAPPPPSPGAAADPSDLAKLWNRDSQTQQALARLVRGAVAGLAARCDATSTYNAATTVYIASCVLGPAARELRACFDAVVAHTSALEHDSPHLRLETLMYAAAASGKADASRLAGSAPLMPLPADAALNVFVREQWPNFVEDMRRPLRRPLLHRAPVSTQERDTHRAALLTLLRRRAVLPAERRVALDAAAAALLAHDHGDGRAADGEEPPPVAAVLVSDPAPVGDDVWLLPSVLLSVRGLALHVVRADTLPAPSRAVATKGGSKVAPSAGAAGVAPAALHDLAAAAGTSVPLVALAVTADAARPFVLHFTVPPCVGVAPFAASFASRAVAAAVLKALDSSAAALRERVLALFRDELRSGSDGGGPVLA